MSPRSFFAVCLAALAAAGLLTHAAQAQEAAARDARLARELTVEVRSAAVGDLLAQLTRALGVKMEAQPGVAAQRVTLRTSQTTLQGLQQALAGLLRTDWRRTGAGDETEYLLLDNAALAARAASLRRERQAGLVNGVLATASALRRYEPESVTAAIRARVAARMPYLGDAALAEITPVYLNQALLAAPLRGRAASTLAQTGSAAVLFYSLPPGSQQLMAEFVLERSGAYLPASVQTLPTASVTPLALNSPRARVEYRTLYGDRWSGLLLLTRAGVGDSWATASLPSALYNLPDYSSLYPEARERATARELFAPVDVRIDTGGLSWDQALATVARAAKINVLTDTYLRPEVFRPVGPPPVIQGGNLEQVLDQLAAYYGQFWWKEGEWYLFRSRHWGEEAAASVPATLLRRLSTSVADANRLTSEDYAALGRLSDEQLMTLHLDAAAQNGRASDQAFDYHQVQLARAGLALAAQMTEGQRVLARGAGLPFTQMNASQQALFVAMAADYGSPVDSYEPYRWRFRIGEQFTPAGAATGAGQTGSLTFRFEAPVWSRSANLGLRLPAPPPRTEPTPAAE